MSDAPLPLTLDFLEGFLAGPRPYSEVMEAWRTSCPRLTVWEDALDAGWVARSYVPGQPPMVCLTEAGAELIKTRGKSLRR